MANRGLPRLSGGILARERAIWAEPCAAPWCHTGAPVAGVIEFAAGPLGFCAACCEEAEQRSYSVRREPFEGVQRRTDDTEPEPRCVHADAGRGPCEGPAKWQVVYRRRRTREVIDTEGPFCFRHGLEHGNRAATAGSIATADMEEIPTQPSEEN